MDALLWVGLVTGFVAYANGANDTFKGVATLFGSRTTGYRQALWWATVTTFAGSVVATVLSGGLVAAFGGKGLVPDAVTRDPAFLVAVGVGAALTVWLATRLGLPVSTTHALTGALAGVGGAAVGGAMALGWLGQRFVVPLIVSPVLALGFTALLYPLLRTARERLGVRKELCLCVEGAEEPVVVGPGGALVLRSSGLRVSVGERTACVERYCGVMWGMNSQQVLDGLHYLSAGAVSFARGLNDTPKIVALLVAAQVARVPLLWGMVVVGVAMMVGGLLHARQVATTMSQRITRMNHGQGVAANLVTAVLVTLASQWGLPVSTTHVSCGALFGLGAVTGQARGVVIRNIVGSWVLTLPVAAGLAAATYALCARW